MLSQDVGPNCAYTKWVYLTITIDKKHNSWNAEGKTSTLSLTCTIYISSIFTNKYCLTNLYYKLTNTEPDEVVWFRPGIPCFGPLYECIYVCLSGCKFPVTILELKTWNLGHSILVDLKKDKFFLLQILKVAFTLFTIVWLLLLVTIPTVYFFDMTSHQMRNITPRRNVRKNSRALPTKT